MASFSSEDSASDHHSDHNNISTTYSPSADISASQTSTDFSPHRLSASYSPPTIPPPSPLLAPMPSHVFTAAHLIADGSLLLPDSDPNNKPPGRTDLCAPEAEMMKQRFAKLLLGEDMSGGSKGVSSALAISNAITNLSATVFGELWRLEPLVAQKKAMWRREMSCFLSVCDYIVEHFPARQDFPSGRRFQMAAPRIRSDLYSHLPSLKRIDAVLIGVLEGFQNTEFWYDDRGVLVGDGEGGSGSISSSSSSARRSVREEEKWWLPCPCVAPNGLSVDARKQLERRRELLDHILKAAMGINNVVLAEMEIPDAYLETLPKSGKSCLGEAIYRYIKADQFSPEVLLDHLNLSSEHKTLEIANQIEAAIHVWWLKDEKRHPLHAKSKKSSLRGKVKGFVSDTGRTHHHLVKRAEDLLHSLRLRYPCLPQTALDMNKIEYNKDVGKAILESYSRVMESVAFNIMARIDDLVYVDDATKKCVSAKAVSLFNPGHGGLPIQKRISPSPFSAKNTPYASPFATPSFCSSTPVIGSPVRVQPSFGLGSLQGQLDGKLGKLLSSEVEKVRSYTTNLDAHERD